MKDTITDIVLGEVQKAVKVAGAGNFAAYVDLRNMAAGDEVAFWLEYDVVSVDDPQPAGDDSITISYEDITAGSVVNAVWALEPVVLEEGQVSQIALVQTAGVPKDFPVRNTNLASAQ